MNLIGHRSIEIHRSTMHMEADFWDFEILAFGIFFFFFLLVIYKKKKLAILKLERRKQSENRNFTFRVRRFGSRVKICIWKKEKNLLERNRPVESSFLNPAVGSRTFFKSLKPGEIDCRLIQEFKLELYRLSLTTVNHLSFANENRNFTNILTRRFVHLIQVNDFFHSTSHY